MSRCAPKHLSCTLTGPRQIVDRPCDDMAFVVAQPAARLVSEAYIGYIECWLVVTSLSGIAVLLSIRY